MLLNPFFGKFGGQFVPELLIPALDQLEKAFVETKDDPSFQAELNGLCEAESFRLHLVHRMPGLTEW